MASEPTPTPGSAPTAPTSSGSSSAKSAKEIAQELGALNSSSSGGTKDPLVYLGNNGLPQAEMRFTAGTSYYDKTDKLSQVSNQYYNWDQKTKDKFLTQLSLAGYDTNSLKDSDIAKLWGGYAEQAASYYSAGVKLTPWDILSKDREQRESYLKTPRTVTQTQTTSSLSTGADAHALFLQAAQSLLGRDPTKSEVSSFQKALNAYEQKNPTVSTTTSNYVGDTLQSQNTSTKGGVTDAARGLIATEDIKADPEYGAYQAATTYFGALQDMIGS